MGGAAASSLGTRRSSAPGFFLDDENVEVGMLVRPENLVLDAAAVNSHGAPVECALRVIGSRLAGGAPVECALRARATADE